MDELKGCLVFLNFYSLLRFYSFIYVLHKIDDYIVVIDRLLVEKASNPVQVFPIQRQLPALLRLHEGGGSIKVACGKRISPCFCLHWLAAFCSRGLSLSESVVALRLAFAPSMIS